MENAKDKSSRSGSKSDLNESSLPLLEGEDVDLKGDPKVLIEMVDTNKSADESGKEESGKEVDSDGKEAAKDEKSSKKKEKKKKEKKEKSKEEKSHTRRISITERLTAGLNLLDRDDREVNSHVNIVFEDVLAEPDSNHGFDGVWGLAFLVFSQSKWWMYRLISAILAIPCGLVWGITFSLLTLLNVWLITPLLCTFNLIMQITHKVWSTIIRTFMDPIFISVGQVFPANRRSTMTIKTPVVKEVTQEQLTV